MFHFFSLKTVQRSKITVYATLRISYHPTIPPHSTAPQYPPTSTTVFTHTYPPHSYIFLVFRQFQFSKTTPPYVPTRIFFEFSAEFNFKNDPTVSPHTYFISFFKNNIRVGAFPTRILFMKFTKIYVWVNTVGSFLKLNSMRLLKKNLSNTGNIDENFSCVA